MIQDCTEALNFNPKYVKAMLRRARIYEGNDKLESALEDVTTACLLEQYTNQDTLAFADRILNKLGISTL